jgi:Cu(I)/Ag(I) efflux system membrane fusion protein
MNTPSRRTTLTLTIGAGVTVLATIAFLLVQDARHGWPFSRHHGLSVASPAVAAPSNPDHPARYSRAALQVDPERLEALGVRFTRVTLEPLSGRANYPAAITPEESRLAHVHTRVTGWVEQLHVNTGDRVQAGSPVAAIFSQELLASQTEYLAALRRSADLPGSAVLSSARARLEVLGLAPRDIERLERSGSPQRLTTLVSPRAGVVVKRGVTAGTAVDPSTEIMTIADLSRVWAVVEVPEREAAELRAGAKAVLRFPGSGRTDLEAPIDFVYPTLTERTRTVRVRFTLANADGGLRPGMYGTATFAGAARTMPTLPRDAIVDTGGSQHVFVRGADGTLEPRVVELGPRTADRVAVLSGVTEGDEVVASGVFLIDSESRLRAGGAAASHAGHAPAPADAQESPPPDSAPAPDHSGH